MKVNKEALFVKTELSATRNYDAQTKVVLSTRPRLPTDRSGRYRLGDCVSALKIMGHKTNQEHLTFVLMNMWQIDKEPHQLNTQEALAAGVLPEWVTDDGGPRILICMKAKSRHYKYKDNIPWNNCKFPEESPSRQSVSQDLDGENPTGWFNNTPCAIMATDGYTTPVSPEFMGLRISLKCIEKCCAALVYHFKGPAEFLLREGDVTKITPSITFARVPSGTDEAAFNNMAAPFVESQHFQVHMSETTNPENIFLLRNGALAVCHDAGAGAPLHHTHMDEMMCMAIFSKNALGVREIPGTDKGRIAALVLSRVRRFEK